MKDLKVSFFSNRSAQEPNSVRSIEEGFGRSGQFLQITSSPGIGRRRAGGGAPVPTGLPADAVFKYLAVGLKNRALENLRFSGAFSKGPRREFLGKTRLKFGVSLGSFEKELSRLFRKGL
jgi:hypothetical protein